MSQSEQPERVHYFSGESLGVADFTTEQEYFLRQNRLTANSLKITGIADGFSVALDDSGASLAVYPGVAFDGYGRQIVLAEPRTIDTPVSADEGARWNLLLAYGEELADFSDESYAGGFKRVREVPQIYFKPLGDVSAGEMVLSIYAPGENPVLNFATREYCSFRPGSIQFASNKPELASPPSSLPSISGYYGRVRIAAWPSLPPDVPFPPVTAPLLKIDSRQTLVTGSLIVEGALHLPGAPISDALQVDGDTSLNGNLSVTGGINQNGVPLTPSQWKAQTAPHENNIYYDQGGVFVGNPQAPDNQNYKFIVQGQAQIRGNVECFGAGSRFIGDGSGLFNLPNSPWVFGTNSSQQNIFYPSPALTGQASMDGVGVGPFTSQQIGTKFPPDASLLVNSTALLNSVAGLQWDLTLSPPQALAGPLMIKSGCVVLEGDLEIHTNNLRVSKGNIEVSVGAVQLGPGVQLSSAGLSTTGAGAGISLGSGNLIVKGDGTNSGNGTFVGAVTAKTYYGDGSNLKGVGYWTQNAAQQIYYAGGVLVGASVAPAGTTPQFYTQGAALFSGPLTVQGPLTPSVGNSKANGVMFPENPNGGANDAAWIRYYASGSGGGDPCTLEIGISNDVQDHIFLNPSGNVGVGVSNPTNASGARLVVAGGIVIQAGAQALPVASAAEPLRMIRGSVDANGTILAGTGFKVQAPGKGLFTLTFTQSYQSPPTVVATQYWKTYQSGINTLDNSLVVAITATGCQILTGDSAGVQTNRPFCFVAMGW